MASRPSGVDDDLLFPPLSPGFHALEAAGGAQALHLLANGQSVAAIVTQVRMPLMDGVDLSIGCARSIRRC